MTKFVSLMKEPSLPQFAGLTRYLFFFLIELDYVIVYFSFYHIVKKNMFKNFRKFMGLLKGMMS